MMILLPLITLLLQPNPLKAERNQVSFDFGWKHRTGLHQWANPNDPAVRNVRASPSASILKHHVSLLVQ